MKNLTLKAYIPSASEYEKYFEEFRAFMSADVSNKASNKGTFVSRDFEGKGTYFLRSAVKDYPTLVECGSHIGGLFSRDCNKTSNGLRIAFNLIYDPNSDIVKNCETIYQKTEVVDYEENHQIWVDGYAPIVKFGGRKCIWLNKEKCERGKSQTMELWTLKLVDRAVPFNEDNVNDFALAEDLIAQCERVLTENCTQEELDMLVPVDMSSKDGYEKAKPNLDKYWQEKGSLFDSSEIDLSGIEIVK